MKEFEIKLSGFRQMQILQQGGQVMKTAFSLVGDNIEWAAPEVMSQNVNYNASADIYSLGITTLELAFNQTPFDDWPPLKMLLCKQHYECPAIKTDKQLSKHFYKFVQACLSQDPTHRYFKLIQTISSGMSRASIYQTSQKFHILGKFHHQEKT